MMAVVMKEDSCKVELKTLSDLEVKYMDVIAEAETILSIDMIVVRTLEEQKTILILQQNEIWKELDKEILCCRRTLMTE